MFNKEYRINQKGVNFYNENIKGRYCNLALQLLISHLIERRPNPCGEDDGWVPLSEAEKITVNAYDILEKLRSYKEIDKREKKSDRA